MINQIPESDWKIFKKFRPIILQRYCDRVMSEVAMVISDGPEDSHQRYLAMFKKVYDSDEKLALMFDRFSRSKARSQLIMYRREKLITDDEFAEFGEETGSMVNFLLDNR